MADIRGRLRRIYDNAVEKREKLTPPDWEIEGRGRFREVLERGGAKSILELGSATGRDAEWLINGGFEVVCTDLSEKMVERCRQRALEAVVMDAARLGFAADAFDAVYAKNCLIHIPNSEIAAALAGIARVVRPGGWVYASMYGGTEFEGIWQGDSWDDKRFFSFRTDKRIRELIGGELDIEAFDVTPECWQSQHYQAVIARKPAA